ESSLAAPDLKQMLAWSWQHLRSAAGSVFVEFIRRLVYVAGLVALPGSALVTGVSPSLAAGVAAFVQRRYEAFTRRLWPYGRGIAAVEFIGVVAVLPVYVLLLVASVPLLAFAWVLFLLPIGVLKAFGVTLRGGPFLTDRFGDFTVDVTDE